MFDIEVTIEEDTASPALAALSDALRPERLLPVLGRSVSNAVRANFDELESTRPNKMGFPRQHYYSGARQGTSLVIDGDSAIIGVRQIGIKMRYYGGTVTAGVNPSSVTGQPTKFLTIPVSAESYGHRAADFPDLKVLWGSDGPYGLGRITQGSIANGDGGSAKQIEVLYVLKEQVEIPADPTMLPAPEALSDAIHDDFGKYVRMAWRRAA
jgi:hypothetical protein